MCARVLVCVSKSICMYLCVSVLLKYSYVSILCCRPDDMKKRRSHMVSMCFAHLLWQALTGTVSLSLSLSCLFTMNIFPHTGRARYPLAHFITQKTAATRAVGSSKVNSGAAKPRRGAFMLNRMYCAIQQQQQQQRQQIRCSQLSCV